MTISSINENHKNIIIIVFSFILISFVVGIDYNYNQSIYGFLTDGSDVLHLYVCPPGYKYSNELMKCISS
jgi:hypothetical protein